MPKKYSNGPIIETYSDRKARICLKSLSNNYKNISQVSDSADIIAYVKADAYGHGLVHIVRRLRDDGVKMFAVASINELILIRVFFSDIKVLVSSSCLTENSLKIISEYNGDIVVFSELHIDLLENISLSNRLNVWLKVNTSMNRMGVSPELLQKCLIRLQRCKNVNADDIVIMSHFACADDISNDKSRRQIDKFIEVTNNLSLRRSMANSAAILNYPESHFDIVRPGLLLYGIFPTPYADLGVTPIMTLESQVISINSCKKGSSIGYGATYTLSEDKLIAVVAFGYADGYPLFVSRKSQVIIAGHRCDVVGRVSMDTMTVDISHIVTKVKIGDIVTIWGPDLHVTEIADCANTIPYELLTRISPRRICYIYNTD